MAGRVFLTGGSGFVGSSVLRELVTRGYAVHALTNRGSLTQQSPRITPIQGDLFNPARLREAMTGCDTVIHLVGIIQEKPSKGVTFERIHVEGTQQVLDAARAVGVKRWIHMSALGTRPNAVSAYHQTKHRAEQLVRESGLDWTIFRPSLIHGPGGEFMQMEAKWARKSAPPFLFMPYFGKGFFGQGGAGRLQPVYVEDVARAFVDAIEKPATAGQVYDLVGAESLTWPQLHEHSARAIVGKRRWIMPIPVWKAKLLLTITPSALLPFNASQVAMAQEDNTADPTPFIQTFGWPPKAFTQTLPEYAAQL